MVTNKTKYRNNLFLLVLFHLLLFTYPTVKKAAHLHTHDERWKKIASTGSPVLSMHEENCPVCEFQFLNFVNDPPPRTITCLTSYTIIQKPSTSESYASLFHYFLLRAPPVSIPSAS